MILHFWDRGRGGFYFTPDDGEKLLVCRKEIYDGAVPSGNSVEAFDLLRLGRITANPDFEERAMAIGRAFSGQPRGSRRRSSGLRSMRGIGPASAERPRPMSASTTTARLPQQTSGRCWNWLM